MQSNTTGKKDFLALKRLSYRVKCALPIMLAGSSLVCHSAQADDFYFDPSLLETSKSGQQAVDLSTFSQDNAQLPGEYIVDIIINNKKLNN